MTGMTSPFGLPFSWPHARRQKYLQLAGVAPDELYRQFAVHPDPDVVAREYLRLSRETYDAVTTAATGEPEVKADYQLDAAPFSTLQAVDAFLAKTGLTGPELVDSAVRGSQRGVDGLTGKPGANAGGRLVRPPGRQPGDAEPR